MLRVLAFFALACSALTGSAAPLWTARTGTVELTSGEAKLRAPDLPRALAVGEELATSGGSTATLDVAGARLLVGPRSTLTLRSEAELQLAGGKVSGSGGEGAGLELSVPGGVSVHPTGAFELRVRSDGRVVLAVRSGQARVALPARTATLQAGEIAVIRGGRILALSSTAASPAQAPQAAPAPAVAAVAPAPSPAAGPVAEARAAIAREAAAPPLTPERHRLIRRDAYRAMLPSLSDETAVELFTQGAEAFGSGLWLTAAERFAACRLLGTPEGWLSRALGDYLEDQIPAALPEGTAGAAARAALKALLRRDWAKAARRAREAGGADGLTAAKALERVAALEPATPESARDLLELPRREADASVVIAALEPALLRNSGQSAQPWWQKSSEALRRAHSARALDALLAAAQAAVDAGDASTAMERLISVFQRSPGDARALALIDRLQRSQAQAALKAAAKERAATKTVKAVAAAKSAPQQPAPPPPPQASLLDVARASAVTKQGDAYWLGGDRRRAAESYQSALARVKDFPAAVAGLKRIAEEARVENGARP